MGKTAKQILEEFEDMNNVINIMIKNLDKGTKELKKSRKDLNNLIKKQRKNE